jgi:hypothetical protein
MALNVDSLTASMTAALPAALDAAKIAAGQLTEDVKKVIPVEIKKLASQFAAIEQGNFSQDVSRMLFDMQVEAFQDVLIALLEVTITHVERLINELLKIVKDVVNTALNFPLL